MDGPSLGLQRSSQSVVGRTVWKSGLEAKGQKLVLASEPLVLKCLQARGRSKSGWKHRTRTTGAARPEGGKQSCPKSHNQ